MSARRHFLAAAASAAALAPTLAFPRAAAAFVPKPRLWDFWAAENAAAARRLDHAPWNAFLGKYVRLGADGISRLPYGAVAAADRQALAAYVGALEAATPRALARREQLAYWINLYNAATVKLVVERWPVRSIRDINIGGGLFERGPWGAKLLTVEGQRVSLDDIEHRILRPIWRDPRIHYAVNCASIGCPNLMPAAFTGENAGALMTRGAAAYVNHPRGARVEGGRLSVSSIYDWFEVDFGGSEKGVIAHLRQYAAPGLKAALEGVSSIAGHDYDWAVNALS
jgi:hypothetical protein